MQVRSTCLFEVPTIEAAGSHLLAAVHDRTAYAGEAFVAFVHWVQEKGPVDGYIVFAHSLPFLMQTYGLIRGGNT